LEVECGDVGVQLARERSEAAQQRVIQEFQNDHRNRNGANAVPQPNLDQPRASSSLHPLWWMAIGGLTTAVVYKLFHWAGWFDKKEKEPKPEVAKVN
jgi:hypothetical protein